MMFSFLLFFSGVAAMFAMYVLFVSECDMIYSDNLAEVISYLALYIAQHGNVEAWQILNDTDNSVVLSSVAE